MIQEIPYKYDPAYKDKKPELTDYLLHYEYNKVMLLKEKEGYVIPTFQDLLSEEDCREKAYYLFSIGERGYYLVDDLKVPEFGSYRLEGMQIFRELEPGYQAFCRYYRKPDLPLERKQEVLRLLWRKDESWDYRTVHGVYRLRTYRVSKDLSGCDRSYPKWGQTAYVPVCKRHLPQVCTDRRLCGSGRDI